jgi:hypothetical protein
MMGVGGYVMMLRHLDIFPKCRQGGARGNVLKGAGVTTVGDLPEIEVESGF